MSADPFAAPRGSGGRAPDVMRVGGWVPMREYPETEAMFRREPNDLVKGSMLALTIDAILDFAGDRTRHFRLIQCEVVSHDAYGTPRELFGKFFGVIADSLRDLLGNDWSAEMESAWRKLLVEIDGVVTHSAI